MKGIGASIISTRLLGKIGICTYVHLKGARKHCMPKIAEDNRGMLSDTKITDFSSIIENRISKKVLGVRLDRKRQDNH